MDGAMIALLVPRQLAPDVELPHVTLAFLGDASELDDSQIAAAITVCEGLTATCRPIKVWTQGHAEFGSEEDGFVDVQLLDGPDLVPLRERVVVALEQAGVPVSHDHGFIPHVTGLNLERDYHFSLGVICLTLGDERLEWGLREDAPDALIRSKDWSPAEPDLEAELTAAEDRMAFHERRLLKALRRYLERVERIVVEKARGPQVRRGTKLWDPPGTKDLDLRQAFDRSRWDPELRDEVADVVADAFREAAAEMGLDIERPEDHPRVTARVDQLLGINEAIETELLRRTDSGTLDRVVMAIRRTFARVRRLARRLAGDHAAGAYNEGRDEAARRQADRFVEKVWLSRQDDRVRPTHRTAHGQRVGAHESFRVGGRRLQYPGDPAGWPEESINCRCTALFVLSSEKHLPGQHDQDRHGRRGHSASGREGLERLVSEGYDAVESLHGGVQASTVKVRFKDGTYGIEKTLHGSYGGAREVVASYVASALGFEDAEVVWGPDPGTDDEGTPWSRPIIERFHEGEVPASWKVERQQSFIQSPSGRRVGLLDALIGNIDRNHGNWIAREDGTVRPIDHTGATFTQGGGTSQFFQAAYSDGWPSDDKPNLFDRRDLEDLKPRLERLLPVFLREFGGNPDSYDGGEGTYLHGKMMKTLQRLTEHAEGTESILGPDLNGLEVKHAPGQHDQESHGNERGASAGLGSRTSLSDLVVPPGQLMGARLAANQKIAAAPVPTEEDRRAHADRLARSKRQGGDDRGSSKDRRRSRENLVREFGDGKQCPCVSCGRILTPDTVSRSRIYPGAAGGRYRLENLVPECYDCNLARSDRPVEPYRVKGLVDA